MCRAVLDTGAVVEPVFLVAVVEPVLFCQPCLIDLTQEWFSQQATCVSEQWTVLAWGEQDHRPTGDLARGVAGEPRGVRGSW